MTEHEVRDVISSMTGSLDEVRREQGWRAVERAIAKPEPVTSTRWPWLVVPALAVAIVALIVWPRSKSPDARPPTTLAAKAGERTVFAHDGLTLTLIGPGAATVQPGPVALRVEVTAGTVLGERTSDDAPTVELAAAGNTTTTRDAQFAIRVVQGTVVLGTGPRALAMIERETHELATPNQREPEPKVAPIAPAPIAPPIEPPRMNRSTSVTPVPPVEPPRVDRSLAPPVAPRIDRSPSTPPVERPVTKPVERPPVTKPVTPSELPPIVVIPLAAKELYARAEASLRVRDPMAAKRLLAQLLAEHPSDALVDAARYDLALIAISERDPAMARSYLQQVIDTARDPSLKNAARKLAATLDKPPTKR